jgi:hypothetical protein
VGYTSNSEREAASYMTWSEILVHVKQTEQCECDEARRQIGNANQDGALYARWADKRRSRWRGSSPIHTPDDAPPLDADYWLKCEIDPKNRDLLREPPPYAPDLVSSSRANQLDKARRFRAPQFPRHQISKLWPQSLGPTTAAAETQAIAFLADRLRADPNMKRDDAWKACKAKFPRLSKRAFFRAWPDARKSAGLERVARPGRKPTRKN